MKIRPHISEKSVELSKKSMFTVLVDKDMTKPRLVSEMKQVYKVDVESVKMLNKKTQTAKKAKGFAKDRGLKKAIVTLKKGEILTGYESFFEQKKEKTAKAAGKKQESK